MRGLLAGAVAAALAMQGVGPAVAQSARPVAVPAASLPEAVAALTAATGTQVLWQGVDYAGRTRPVSGAATVDAALDAMLAGTGLTWRRRGPASVEIVRAPQPVRLDAGGVELPQIDVTAALPSGGTLGPPPPAYAGGQLATGTQTGLFGNRSIFETPFSQRGFTRDFIENAQARGLTDVLAADPTVRPLTNGGSNFEGFLIRGFNIGRQAFLFDGLAGLIQNYHQVVEPLERIEVLNGPSVFLNGQPPTGGVGGIVNLIPKRATDTPVTDLRLGYTAPGNLGTSVDIGRRFGPDNALGVRLNAGTQGGNTAIRDQSERQDFAFLALDWRGERARFALDLGYQRYEIDGVRIGYGLTATAPVPRPPRNDRLQGQPWETDRFERRQAVLRGEYDVAPNWTAGVAFGYSRYDTDQRITSVTVRDAAGNGTATPSRFDTLSENTVVEATLRGRVETGPLRHLLAFSASRIGSDGGSRFVTGSARPTNVYAPPFIPESALPALAPFGRTGTTTIRGVAIGDEIGLWNDRILFTAGLRWSDVVVRNFNPDSGARTSRYQADRISPAFGLVVRPTPELSLYANYVEALEQGGVAPTTAVNAGEAAPPLVSDQVEIGAKYDFGRVAVTAALFRIEKANSYVDPASRRFTTEGRQVHQGLELTAFGELLPGLRLIAGVTLLDAEVTRSAGGALDGRRPVAVPRSYGSIGLDWDVPGVPGLALNGSVQATGNQAVDAANTQRIRGYALLNLGARYTVTMRDTPVTLRFNVLNVTGEDYYASAGFGTLLVGAPRTFLLSSAFRF
jgi:iron complex outermembrane receptor protein